MGLESDAVSDPRAVVIHFHDASSTGRTVVGAWWFDFIAFRTVSELIELVYLMNPFASA